FYRLLYLQRSLTAASSLDDMLIRFHRWARALGPASERLPPFPERWPTAEPSNKPTPPSHHSSSQALALSRDGPAQKLDVAPILSAVCECVRRDAGRVRVGGGGGGGGGG
ncbi:DUF484 family protein, partial [Escherichia coli]|uniref:DUF484 family protein n=1 Tax=Escherichia coli TaxID=562 RepID=UPI0035D63BA3